MTALLDHLQSRVHKLLVPYVVGGLPDKESFPDVVRSVARYADAVEIGLPFSDPLMDGPVIAAAAQRAIDDGVGPLDALDLSAGIELDVPRLAMTYYNPIHRVGIEDFCARAVKAGFAGLIVPDIPLEESQPLRAAAADVGLGWVPLVAPTSPPERVAAIAATATGFVYAVSTLGVTGTRQELSARAAKVVSTCRDATDLPVLVGIGISNADQAVAAATDADGVVIGSAVVGMILERGREAAEAFLSQVRGALDAL